MNKILNLGSINIDNVYTVERFVKAGETIASKQFRVYAGGKGLNQSIALARAGGNVIHAGTVGRDGVDLVNMLQDEGVDVSYIAECETPTGHTIIQVNDDGQNCILLYPGANYAFEESRIDGILNTFDKDDILITQNEVNCIAYAMRSAAKKGMRIAFNPSPFCPEIRTYPLHLVDWFILNEIEGEAFTGKSDPEEILSDLGVAYPQATIVLTLGENGVICKSGERIIHQNAYQVLPIDTTAAGDTFTGYFISLAATGEKIEECLSVAAKAAAISVSKRGAAASIPKMTEVRGKVEICSGS